jgi:hypothetical protein
LKYFFTSKLSITLQSNKAISEAISNKAIKKKMINQQLSLVIPRVFPQWVDEEKIITIFRQQQIGIISKVSIVRMPDTSGTGPSGTGPSGTGPSKTGTSGTGKTHPIYKAYLYFSVWFENIITENFQKRIYGKDKQARVVYDDPWFWTVFENTERVKLSKNDKRLMRLSAEIYKNTLFVQTQQEELAREMAEQKLQVAEQKLQVVEQKHQMAKQNNVIQNLQNFCIKNGLEIPFWSANHPPSAEDSSFEALSAETAVNSAEFVLHTERDFDDERDFNEGDFKDDGVYNEGYYNDEGDFIPRKYSSIPYKCAESVLEEEYGENFNYGFIPVKSYSADWKLENPYINNTPEQSRLCSYLGRCY